MLVIEVQSSVTKYKDYLVMLTYLIVRLIYKDFKSYGTIACMHMSATDVSFALNIFNWHLNVSYQRFYKIYELTVVQIILYNPSA